MNKTKTILSTIMRVVVVLCSGYGLMLDTILQTPSHWSSLLYFTLQSNIWILVVCLVGLIDRMRGYAPGRLMSILKMVFTVSIGLTGIVFCFILAPTIEGNPFKTSSVCLHVITPLAAVVDYLLCTPTYSLQKKDAWFALLPPAYYFAFAAVGYVLNWPFQPDANYPYFFLNWGSPLGAIGLSTEFPFMGVLWYVALTFPILYGAGRLLVGVAKRGRRSRGKLKIEN